MPKLRQIKPKELVKILKNKGFVQGRREGSHISMINYSNGARTVVAMHNREIPKGTLMAILRESGLSKDDLTS